MRDPNIVLAWKLVRLRRNGTIGPLFIDRKQVIPIGRWVRSKNVPTPGYKPRPGWHAIHAPVAPHLSKKGRVWARVVLKGVTEYPRPEHQGGMWYTAKWMRVEWIAHWMVGNPAP